MTLPPSARVRRVRVLVEHFRKQRLDRRLLTECAVGSNMVSNLAPKDRLTNSCPTVWRDCRASVRRRRELPHTNRLNSLDSLPRLQPFGPANDDAIACRYALRDADP